jgi:hypothetical protein
MIDMKIRNSSLMIQVFNYANQRGYKLVDAPVSSHNKEARERDFAIFIVGKKLWWKILISFSITWETLQTWWGIGLG